MQHLWVFCCTPFTAYLGKWWLPGKCGLKASMTSDGFRLLVKHVPVLQTAWMRASLRSRCILFGPGS